MAMMSEIDIIMKECNITFEEAVKKLKERK